MTEDAQTYEIIMPLAVLDELARGDRSHFVECRGDVAELRHRGAALAVRSEVSRP